MGGYRKRISLVNSERYEIRSTWWWDQTSSINFQYFALKLCINRNTIFQQKWLSRSWHILMEKFLGCTGLLFGWDENCNLHESVYVYMCMYRPVFISLCVFIMTCLWRHIWRMNAWTDVVPFVNKRGSLLSELSRGQNVKTLFWSLCYLKSDINLLCNPLVCHRRAMPRWWQMAIRKIYHCKF